MSEQVAYASHISKQMKIKEIYAELAFVVYLN